MSDLDLEKGNYEYYLGEKTTGQGCCRRCWNGLIQHPFTLLEVNGRVIDVQRTFAARPSWLICILKLLLLGVSIDVLVRELFLSYTGDLSFYMAYLNNWALVFCILYFLLSTINSITCGMTTAQPSAAKNRTSCTVLLTWFFYTIALSYQGLNAISFWSLVFYEWNDDSTNDLTALSYFTIMKSGGLLLLLLVEGQVINRIPLRFAHLVFMEFGFLWYLGWSAIHHFLDIGNPDDSSTDSIYWFLNWSDPQEVNHTALGCAITMLGVLPVMFVVLHLLSLPCRRYMPLVEPDGRRTDEEDPMPTNDAEDVIEVPLPPGRVGIVLAESPPVLTKMSPSSPLNDTGVTEGMVVDTLTLSDGTVFYNPMTSEELTSILKDTVGDAGRFIRFINPETMDVTVGPEGEQVEAPEEMEMVLPSGSIGLIFHKKGPPPIIKSIKPSSPLLDMYPELQAGMVVDTLTLEDGETHYEINTKELTVLLKENRHSEGRVLVVKRSDQPLTPRPEEEELPAGPMPDEVVVPLPAGPMMVMLEGMPPQITSMAPESPLHDYGVVEGMVVDTIELPDGSTYYEMATPDCKVKLSEYGDSSDRVVRFINPDTMPLTKEPMTINEIDTGNGMGSFDEKEEEEDEIRENLLSMGFDSDAIDEAFEYFKSVGEPLDADACMTRIITQ